MPRCLNEMPARPGIHRRSAVPDTQRTGVFIGRGIGGRAVSRRRLCSVGTPCSRAPAAIAAGTPPLGHGAARTYITRADRPPSLLDRATGDPAIADRRETAIGRRGRPTGAPPPRAPSRRPGRSPAFRPASGPGDLPRHPVNGGTCETTVRCAGARGRGAGRAGSRAVRAGGVVLGRFVQHGPRQQRLRRGQLDGSGRCRHRQHQIAAAGVPRRPGDLLPVGDEDPRRDGVRRLHRRCRPVAWGPRTASASTPAGAEHSGTRCSSRSPSCPMRIRASTTCARTT